MVLAKRTKNFYEEKIFKKLAGDMPVARLPKAQ